MEMLTTRQKKLLQLIISEEEYKTIDFYSQKMKVSERTVHNDLKLVSGYLSKGSATLHKKPGVGIKIKAKPDYKLMLLNDLDLKKEEIDPLSTKIRKMKIILQLLYANQSTSLQKLSEEFMVSKTSIVKDLEKVKEWLKSYGLLLVKNHEGTRVKGNEESTRRAIAGITNELLNLNYQQDYDIQSSSRLDAATFSGLSNLFEDLEVTQVEHIIERAEKKLQYRISHTYFLNLVTHILILIKRVRSHQRIAAVNEPELHHQTDYVLKMYTIAKEVSEEISECFDISIPENEIHYIKQYLLCSGMEKDISPSNVELFVNHADSSLKELVDEMVQTSTKVMNLNLQGDKELYTGLLMHIKPMVNRLKYQINIKNPLLEEIKHQYSATFGMTWLVCSIIERKLNVKVNEDEIGYVTLHFQAAIERCVGLKRAIVVCPGGIGTSQLIANRIKRLIPQLEIAEVISLGRLSHFDLSNIDFIISTVPLHIEVKPVITISSLVSEVDIKNINNFFWEDTFSKKEASITCANLFKMLDPQLIFPQVDFTDKEQLIDYLCHQLQSKGYVKEGFQQSVVQRENIASTSLGNSVAIPHGEDQYVERSKIIIATCSNALDWEEGEVKIIFLLALKFGEQIVVKDILTDLYSIFDSENTLTRLTECTTAEKVMALLGEGM
ncbi:BglG family transcription antiterminator [Priestia megaterium]|uniref:BglG family transcription antiterminator n=1 Tax=Priestia megaterium TaxID=1404 RepID=UPI002E1BA063|nr:BglG family transcription antiterminator [Priestia megaterium]